MTAKKRGYLDYPVPHITEGEYEKLKKEGKIVRKSEVEDEEEKSSVAGL